MDRKYKSIIEHYENCFLAYGDSAKGNDWPNLSDVHTRFEVMLGIVQGEEPTTLLDFGCGTSMLYDYINQKRKRHIKYIGLDASPRVIEYCRTKHPGNSYILADIFESTNQLTPIDYIVMNGVFTEKLSLTDSEMYMHVKKILEIMYKYTKKGIAFNVMSKYVDWERKDLFHASIDRLMEIITRNFSRNFVIRNDYGLYEYTIYFYRE